MTGQPANAVDLIAVTKTYQETAVIRDVTMSVEDGAFVTILGPSGCGKSTLLRMICGFVEPDTGDLRIRGRSMLGLPPHKRDTAMVFQDYALFPHRSIAENIGFGLRMRKVETREITRRVGEMLELINLSGFGERRVSEISGGQAQRVALGRALIVQPSVLLLDEPLGALDMKLRKQMQEELKRIHRELGLTFVAVTHDQEEALTLSDRIAVMNAGRIEQFDTPEALYKTPETRFVADFVGGANLIDVTADSAGRLALAGSVLCEATQPAGTAATVVIRPEMVTIGAAQEGWAALEAEIEEILFAGAVQQVIGRLADGTRITAHLTVSAEDAASPAPERGSRRHFRWRRAAASIVTR